MPRVPLQQSEYTGVPTVEPSSANTPEISVRAPIEAFGGATAEGMKALGKGLGDVGNELFARAYAMQQLNNEAEVNQAEANHIMEQAQLGAQYGELRGRAAKDEFPKFQEDSEALRQKYRNSLSSPMAQKMFDGRSLSTMSYSIRHATYHAASEFTKYQLGASQSKVQALSDQALQPSIDDGQFNSSLESTANEVRQQGLIAGWDADQTEQHVKVAQSNLWSKRVLGMAKDQPFAAEKIMRDAIANGDIRGEDIKKVQDYVRQSRNTVGAKNISHEVLSQSDPVASVPGSFVAQIKKSEGFTPVAKWDFKQFSSGYGTKAKFAGERITEAEADQRFRTELGNAANVVDRINPNLSAGTRAAMTSLTYNAGDAWTKGRLGDAIAKGDEAAAKELFLQYNRAGGQVNPGLVARREREAAWFGKESAAPPSLRDQVDLGVAMAKQLVPDDPLFPDYVRNQIEADHNRQRRIKLDDDYTNRQTVEAGLMGGDSGKLPTTLEELKGMSPTIEAAWTALPPSKQRQYLGALARNAKGETQWTGEGLRDYQRLKGMAAEDPAQFLDENVIDAKIPNSARRELVNLQIKVKSGAAGDPRMTKYMTAVAGDLNAAGISKTSDPDRYYQFRGAFEDAIHSHQQDKTKAPTNEEARQIAARLLQEQATPWWLNPWSKTPTFAMPVPTAEAEAIRADPTWQRLGIIPTDQQIQRIYTRSLYQRLFSKPTVTEEAVGGPTVPMSR